MIGFVFISHYNGIIIFINNLNIVNYMFYLKQFISYIIYTYLIFVNNFLNSF